jgi:hypothetical protein
MSGNISPWRRTANLSIYVDVKALRPKPEAGLLRIDLFKRKYDWRAHGQDQAACKVWGDYDVVSLTMG